MRIVVTGGRGRLGRLVVPELERAGATVRAPLRAEVDWTRPGAAWRALRGADRVLALASWTDVRRAQLEPAACVRDTVGTVEATLRACSRTGSRLLYVSSDYALAPLRAQPAGVYAASKLVAEQLVLGTPRAWGHAVARVAFVTPEQAQGWGWVDGVCRAHRCWVDELVPQVVAWALAPEPERLAHLGGPEPVTLAELLRARWPEHPALDRVITDPDELARLAGNARPPDTSWD